MSETRIDYTRGRVYTPYLLFSPSPSFSPYPPFFFFSPPSFPSPLFSEHCENVYGLNNEEIDYVWKEYKDIILDKING